MRRIVIGFSTTKEFKPFSWAIRAVLGTPFSHTYIKFKSDKFDRVLVYQASGTMVNFMEEKRVLETHKIIQEFEFEVSDEVYTKTIQFAIDKSGVPYGMSQIFGILYVKALGLFGIKAKNPFPQWKWKLCLFGTGCTNFERNHRLRSPKRLRLD